MRHQVPRAAHQTPAAGSVSPTLSSGGGRAQAAIDASQRMATQRRLINDVFPASDPLGATQKPPAQRVVATGGAVIQRYTAAPNGWNISTGGQFAVRNEGQNGRLYVAAGVNPAPLQHVVFNKLGGSVDVDGTQMSEVEAVLANKEAMDAMHCGYFSKAVTGITETQENEHAPPGRSLYTKNVTHDVGNVQAGWDNHYAPVILADADDRGTFETAVGLNYCWFGIYGTAKGQTFRYKTQVGNIQRALSKGWISQETHQTILTALERYKGGLISEQAEQTGYVEAELNKLEALVGVRRVEAPLPEAKVERTPQPQTPEQQREELQRNLEKTGNTPEFERRQRQEQLEREKNEQVQRYIKNLSVIFLALLAFYLLSGR